jgi:hypothetical protein
MGKRLSRLSIALVALVTAACPYDRLLTSSRGIAVGGPGGGGSGSNVLVIIQQPLTGTAGEILTPAILVAAADTLGSLDTAFSATVTMALATNNVGGRLSGTLGVAAVRGIASFGDLVLDKAGSGYVLRASAQRSTQALSAAITILVP